MAECYLAGYFGLSTNLEVSRVGHPKFETARQLIKAGRHFDAYVLLQGVDEPDVVMLRARLKDYLQKRGIDTHISGPSPETKPPDFASMTEFEKLLAQEQQLRTSREKQSHKEAKAKFEETQHFLERAEVLKDLYRRVGDRAFMYSGDLEGWRGKQKIKAWESIQKRRYEEARYNVRDLKRLNKHYSDIEDWTILLNYILDECESKSDKIRRLGITGTLDRPVDLGGCAVSLGCLLQSVLLFVGVPCAMFTYSAQETIVVGIIVASLLAYLFLYPRLKWLNHRNR